MPAPLVPLLRSGLLGAEEVVDDRIVVRPMGGRVTALERPAGRGTLVKPADPRAPERGLREAAVLRALLDAGGPAASVVPVPVDGPGGVLALELLDARGLEVLEAHDGPASCGIAAAAGRALALVHGLAPDIAPVPPAGPAPVFRLARPNMDLLLSLSPANRECLELLQAEGIADALAGLADEWTDSAFAHGDLHLANVMADPDRAGGPRVWIVDWERGGPGDPRWDLGFLLAGYLGLWISSMPSAPDVPATALAGRAARPLESSLAPAMRAAWDGYRSVAATSSGDPVADLTTTVRMTGAALVEIALMLGQHSSRPTNRQLLHLHVGGRLMDDPLETGLALIGLGPADLGGVGP